MVRNRKEKDNTKAKPIFSNTIPQMDFLRLYWVSQKADPEARLRCKVITLEVSSGSMVMEWEGEAGKEGKPIRAC